MFPLNLFEQKVSFMHTTHTFIHIRLLTGDNGRGPWCCLPNEWCRGTRTAAGCYTAIHHPRILQLPATLSGNKPDSQSSWFGNKFTKALTHLVCAHVPISLLSEPYPLTRKRLSQHLCMFASCDFTLLTLCRTISWLVELLTQHN